MDNLFFITSKIAWAFMSPSNLIVFALVFGTLLLLFGRITAAKWFLIPSACFAFLMMLFPFQDYLLQPLEERFPVQAKLPYDIDGVIVLGGGEDQKSSLSWSVAEMGKGGDRFAGAAHLARTYPRIPIIYTGGSSSLVMQDKNNSHIIAQTLLTTMGVHPDRLVIESKSRNTYENFVNTKPLLPKADGTYLLVTSAFHMPRSVGIARKLNINVVPYPVDFYSNAHQFRGISFEYSSHMSGLEIAWREWIGLTVYYLTDKTSNWFPAPEAESKVQIRGS